MASQKNKKQKTIHNSSFEGCEDEDLKKAHILSNSAARVLVSLSSSQPSEHKERQLCEDALKHAEEVHRRHRIQSFAQEIYHHSIRENVETESKLSIPLEQLHDENSALNKEMLTLSLSSHVKKLLFERFKQQSLLNEVFTSPNSNKLQENHAQIYKEAQLKRKSQFSSENVIATNSDSLHKAQIQDLIVSASEERDKRASRVLETQERLAELRNLSIALESEIRDVKSSLKGKMSQFNILEHKESHPVDREVDSLTQRNSVLRRIAQCLIGGTGVDWSSDDGLKRLMMGLETPPGIHPDMFKNEDKKDED